MNKRYPILITILLSISPIFGVILSNAVGYTELLDHIADMLPELITAAEFKRAA